MATPFSVHLSLSLLSFVQLGGDRLSYDRVRCTIFSEVLKLGLVAQDHVLEAGQRIVGGRTRSKRSLVLVPIRPPNAFAHMIRVGQTCVHTWNAAKWKKREQMLLTSIEVRSFLAGCLGSNLCSLP